MSDAIQEPGAPPRLAESSDDPAGYRRVYAPLGQPGGCLVQEVTTSVRYLRGAELVAEYTSCYGEYFRFGPAGTLPPELWDLHDFVLHRDGWTPRRLWDLLRREGLVSARLPAAGPDEPHLEVTKRFLLAPGRVASAQPRLETPDGAAFGYLTDGPRAPARAGLELVWAGQRRPLRPERPHPFGHPAAGTGRWSGAPGWRADEVWRYRFATASGRLEDAGGYRSWSPVGEG